MSFTDFELVSAIDERAKNTQKLIGTELVRAKIDSVSPDGFVSINILGEVSQKTYPAISAGFAPIAGDNVWVLRTVGGYIILGTNWKQADETLAALRQAVSTLQNEMNAVEQDKYNKTGGVITGRITAMYGTPEISVFRTNGSNGMRYTFRNQSGDYTAMIDVKPGSNELLFRNGVPKANPYDLPVSFSIDTDGAVSFPLIPRANTLPLATRNYADLGDTAVINNTNDKLANYLRTDNASNLYGTRARVYPSLQGGWTNLSYMRSLSYIYDRATGDIIFRGGIGGGTRANGTIVARIVAAYWPSNDVFIPVEAAANANSQIRIDNQGYVTCHTVGGRISFDGASYNIDA